MPLQILEPPNAVVKTILPTVKNFATHGKFGTPSLSKARPMALSLTAPHPVYTMHLNDLVEGKMLSFAKLTGWRYLIQDGEKVIAYAEAVADAEGAAYEFSEFNEGPFVRSTANALITAEKLIQVEQGSYEFHLLLIPALYVVALWLKDKTGNQDMIIPIKPTPHFLEPDRVYFEAEFLTALKEPAQQLFEFFSSEVKHKN